MPAGRSGRSVELPRLCAEVGYPVVIKSDAAETHLSDAGWSFWTFGTPRTSPAARRR